MKRNYKRGDRVTIVAIGTHDAAYPGIDLIGKTGTIGRLGNVSNGAYIACNIILDESSGIYRGSFFFYMVKLKKLREVSNDEV